MSNDPEFETVISEADAELGAVPVPATLEPSQSAASAPSTTASNGWNLVSLTGLQQYFDFDTKEIVDRLNIKKLFTKRRSLIDAIVKKPDLYVAFWTMFVCVIVHGWNAVLFYGAKSPLFFNSCFRYVFTYVLTLLLSSAVLWIGSMYVSDSLSMMSSVSYSGYLILLHEAVFLLFTLTCSLFMFSARSIVFYFTIILGGYVNYLNIYDYYNEKNKSIAVIITLVHSILIPFCMTISGKPW